MGRINSHDDNISITINLADPTSSTTSFLTSLMLADDAPVSARVASYSSLAAVQAAVTASELTAAVGAAAAEYFGQPNKPSVLKVGKRVSSSETWTEAVDAVRAFDDDFYGIFIESRVPTDIVAVAANLNALRVAETKRYLFIAQDDDADWLTSGVPGAYSSAAAYEGLVIAWHEDDTEDMDAAYAGNRLSFDPDITSVPWNAPLEGVASYSTALTQAQKDFLDENNANHGLPFYGAATFYVDKGFNIAGRPVSEIVTSDWFHTRLAERTAQLIVDLSTAGKKLPLTAAGQSLVLGVVKGLFSDGVTAGHFVAGQTSVEPEAITAADITAQRLRFTGSAQLQSSARVISFTFNFTNNAINT